MAPAQSQAPLDLALSSKMQVWPACLCCLFTVLWLDWLFVLPSSFLSVFKNTFKNRFVYYVYSVVPACTSAPQKGAPDLIIEGGEPPCGAVNRTQDLGKSSDLSPALSFLSLPSSSSSSPLFFFCFCVGDKVSLYRPGWC